MRSLILLTGLFGYMCAIAALLALFGFIAGLGPHGGINDGPETSLILALAIDTSLIALFGLHHSGAARRRFKSMLGRYLPPEMERSLYLIATTAIVALLIVAWRPIPIVLWSFDNPLLVAVIRTLFLGVMVMMLLATFQIGHLGFFGLRQPIDAYFNNVTRVQSFSTGLLYGLVRHPISLGWIVAPWLVPEFTVGQLVFAFGSAVYVILATPFEERDLRREIGPRYDNYRARVPALIPFFRSRRG